MQNNRLLTSLSNIYRLGLKELRSLTADKVLLVLIVWAFSGGIYVASTATSTELHNAPVAVVDEDQSPLSRRLVDALYPPYFKAPVLIALRDIDPVMARWAISASLPAACSICSAKLRTPLVGRNPSMESGAASTYRRTAPLWFCTMAIRASREMRRCCAASGVEDATDRRARTVEASR